MLGGMPKPLLPQPIGRQRDVLYLPAQGHTVVLGTAGSGKTTLAMLRAKYLSTPALPHCGKTLLLSFNNALLRYFESFADLEGAGVDIRTYHHFARGYLKARGKMSTNAICSPDEFVEQARIIEKSGTPQEAVFDRSLPFLVDEIKWIAQHGISSLAEYEEVERTGRHGARLLRKDRAALFRLMGTYKQRREEAGFQYDWDDLAVAVCAELQNDGYPRMYKHIVIDEGQDFSPMMLRSLAAAIPMDGTLTFFGDAAQQIYGNKISWRSAGLSVQAPWKFEDNFRNTPEIARLAVAISEMPYFPGTADLVIPRMIRAAGALPALVACSDPVHELDVVASLAIARSKTESVGVLFRDRSEETAVSKKLGRAAVRLHKDMRRWEHGPALYYGTYAAAKGLEFDTVILPRTGAAALPDPQDVQDFGESEANAINGKLLYVGVTRARSTLVLTYSGKPSQLLPQAPNLFLASRA